MKRLLLLVGITLTFYLSGTVAYAETTAPSRQSSTNEQMAWVVKDVTRQDNYKLLYETLNAHGQVISTRKVIPPLGSLVVSMQEPLSQATREHIPYIVATGSTIPSNVEFSDLHRRLFDQLNPSATQSFAAQMTASTQANTGNQIVFGQFNTNDTTLGYDVYYSDFSNGYLALTNFYTWQVSGSGHAWEEFIAMSPPGSSTFNWTYNFPSTPEITNQSTDVSWSGSAGNPQGSYFQTEVEGDNWWGENFFGYTTLN
ncbi:MAG: hypothetical protein ACYCYO_12530 [Bacilli bacterium]